MLLLGMSLAFAGQRAMEIEVEVPVGEADARSLYRSSTEIWRMRNAWVVGGFESSNDALTCSVDGRWIRAEVEYRGSEFPTSFPQTMVCQNEDLSIDVVVVQDPPPVEGWVDGRMIVPRQWGRFARSVAIVPMHDLEDARVSADVIGVECVVDTGAQTMVSVRVGGGVIASEALCELPTKHGGLYTMSIDLPRGG